MLLLTLSSSSVFAFDGERPGFTCGLGLGYNAIVQVTNERLDFDKSDDGFGLSLMLGAANERNLVVFALTGGNVNYRYFGYDDESEISAFAQEIRWYHYFGRTGRSWFSCVGLGVVELSPCRSPFEGSGLNYVVGGGFEIFEQVSVGAYFHGGYVEDHGYRHGVRLFQIMTTIMAY